MAGPAQGRTRLNVMSLGMARGELFADHFICSLYSAVAVHSFGAGRWRVNWPGGRSGRPSCRLLPCSERSLSHPWPGLRRFRRRVSRCRGRTQRPRASRRRNALACQICDPADILRACHGSRLRELQDFDSTIDRLDRDRLGRRCRPCRLSLRWHAQHLPLRKLRPRTTRRQTRSQSASTHPSAYATSAPPSAN